MFSDRLKLFLIVVASAGAALGGGFLAADTPHLPLAAGASIIVAVRIFRRPVEGLYLFALTIPFENLILVGGGATATRFLGIVVFGAWALKKVVSREDWSPLYKTVFFPAGACFVLVALLSSIWAEVPSETMRGVKTLAQLFALALMAIDLLSSQHELDGVAKALVLGGTIAAALNVYFGVTAGGERVGTKLSGINATAVILVLLLPFAFYLIRTATRVGWRIAAIVYCGASVAGLVYTSSRMGLLLYVPVIAILSWQTIRGGTGRGWLLGFAVSVLLVGSVLVPWERVEQRLNTAVPYIYETSRLTEATGETSARGYHLRVGLAIARAHPLIGVGYQNYGVHFKDEYQWFVPGYREVKITYRSPHSSYIGILADLGIVGTISWLILQLVVLVGVIRTWRRCRTTERYSQRVLTQAIMLSLGLYIFLLGWYMTVDGEKLFWLIIGMAVALRRVVPSTAESIDDSPLQKGMAVESVSDAMLPA